MTDQEMTVDTQYQPQTVPGSAGLQPSAVFPAQLAQYIPPPQPLVIPGQNGQPGVIVMPNGESYYGHAPVVYAQPPAPIDPQVAGQVALMNAKARMMAGGGVLLAGGGVLAGGVGLAATGLGAGGLMGLAALVMAGKLTGSPKRITNHNSIREEYHQHVENVATGWFGRATGSINSESSHTTSSTIN
jgi:hypothetical protein